MIKASSRLMELNIWSWIGLDGSVVMTTHYDDDDDVTASFPYY